MFYLQAQKTFISVQEKQNEVPAKIRPESLRRM
jgi:hypothetical protein